MAEGEPDVNFFHGLPEDESTEGHSEEGRHSNHLLLPPLGRRSLPFAFARRFRARRGGAFIELEIREPDSLGSASYAGTTRSDSE